MFGEELGFVHAADFTSPPRLLGWAFPDQDADESWSLYDHPRVSIFAKQRDLSEAEFDALLGGTWEGAIPMYVQEGLMQKVLANVLQLWRFTTVLDTTRFSLPPPSTASSPASPATLWTSGAADSPIRWRHQSYGVCSGPKRRATVIAAASQSRARPCSVDGPVMGNQPKHGYRLCDFAAPVQQ